MDLGARHRPYAVLSTNERLGHLGSVCPNLFGWGGFRCPSSPVGEEDSVSGFVFPVGLLMGGDVFDQVAVDGGGIGRFGVCRPGPSANHRESFDGTRVPTRSRPDKERTVVPTLSTGRVGCIGPDHVIGAEALGSGSPSQVRHVHVDAILPGIEAFRTAKLEERRDR
jgi:hypothetical protein